MVELNLPIVVGAAVIDSINPCAFGVLIFLLAYLAETVKKKVMMLVNGLIYILGVFVTYLVAGLVLLPVIRKLGAFSTVSYYVIAGVIFLAGLIELKDVFWYGKGFSLAIFPSEAKRIETYVKRVSDKPLTAFLLGVFVALVELPCTGAVYLAVLSLMSFGGVAVSEIVFLILYNLIFVLPLGVILWFVYRGFSTEKFEAWRQRNKRWMRLAIGLMLIGLAVFMVWYTT